MTGDKIRLSKCNIGSDELIAAERALKSEYLGMGIEVKSFETEIRAYLKTDLDVICVNSGTSALVLALSCLGIGPGDEVLVPSITYVASFQAVSNVGATPVACDVCLSSGFLDVNDVRNKISKKTKAIMPVHYGSNSSDMSKVYGLAKEFDLRVIEDAAQAFGCKRNDQLVGSVGDIICFSFDGIKNITCGEGGAILTADNALAEKLRNARLLGVMKDTENRFSGNRSWDFQVEELGFRAHMSNINAAIGRTQLCRLNAFITKRQSLALQYKKILANVKGVVTFSYNYEEICPHIFPVRIQKTKRDAVIAAFEEKGIEYGFHYKPNHLLSYFKRDNVRLKNSELLWEEMLTLPLHVDLSASDVKLVCSVIERAVEDA